MPRSAHKRPNPKKAAAERGSGRYECLRCEGIQTIVQPLWRSMERPEAFSGETYRCNACKLKTRAGRSLFFQCFLDARRGERSILDARRGERSVSTREVREVLFPPANRP